MYDEDWTGLETMKESARYVLEKVKADCMVKGHHVQIGGINAWEDGTVWRIDGGSWDSSDDVPEVLEVVRKGDEEIVAVLTPTERIPGNYERYRVLKDRWK